MNWLLDLIPWWFWGLLVLVAMGATYSLWMPLWALMPATWRIAIIGAALAVLAALWGRNRGATGALQRAKEKEQARANDILKKGADARARVEREPPSGVRSDDGWRRED